MTESRVPEVHEHDAMTCRACGRRERASEGAPCQRCGTFICIICQLQGVLFCRACEGKDGVAAAGSPPPARA